MQYMWQQERGGERERERE